jgi:signal transduction histidine kinase
MRKYYEEARVLDGSCAEPASAADEPRPLDEPHAAVRHTSVAPPEHHGGMGELLHRGQASALLEECGARLRAGRPVVVMIDGDRGSGKSALLGAVAAGCEAGVVLRARCHGAERGFRFGVVSQLLNRLPADDLALVAPALAEGAGAAEGREYDLLDRFYRVVRAVAMRGPVVLAIDDVHMADPLSAQWFSYLARRLDDLPAGVLVTVRSGGLSAGAGDPATADLIADLGALAHSRLVRTGPLCAECAGTLIARKLGRPVDPEFARQCHALTRGNPRVLGVVAARLPAGAGAGTGADGAALEVAARALAGITLGWLRQDDLVKARVAEHFAVCGGGTLEMAAMLAGQGEDVARAARVTLRLIGLLDSRAPDRFAHPAMGEAITDLLRPQARAAMHAHAATMLSQIGEPAAPTAEHAMSAGTIGEPWARQVLRHAAQQAAGAGDWPRGVRYLSRALLEPGPPRQTLAITAEVDAFEFHLDVGARLRRAAVAADLVAADPDSAADLAVLADAALAAEDGDAAAVFCRAAAALAAAKIPARSALLRLAAPALLSGRERFAALVTADRAAILASFAERLEAMHNPVSGDSRARDQAMANAMEAIADITGSLRAGRVKIDDRYKLLAGAIGEARAEAQVSPSDSLRAAEAFFDVTVTSLARHVENDPALLPCFVRAVLVLSDSISLRVRHATLPYTEYLLDRVHQAHLDERHRIARDLHDQLGEGLSVALRHLELHEIAIAKEGYPSTPRTKIAKDALTDGMRRLRLVTSDLRQDSVASLGKALLTYVESTATEARVRLRISGDETWASQTVVDEAFLIIREAIRNALTHGDPQLVLVGVALTPDNLRGWVDDDGRGFVVADSAAPDFGGNGLTSMRERAGLIGGHLTVVSVPGQGTHVELFVMLTSHRDVRSD